MLTIEEGAELDCKIRTGLCKIKVSLRAVTIEGERVGGDENISKDLNLENTTCSNKRRRCENLPA